MSSRAAPSSKRPRTGSGDETATDTSSNTISAGDMAHNYQMLHQKMSECFDYILRKSISIRWSVSPSSASHRPSQDFCCSCRNGKTRIQQPRRRRDAYRKTRQEFGTSLRLSIEFMGSLDTENDLCRHVIFVAHIRKKRNPWASTSVKTEIVNELVEEVTMGLQFVGLTDAWISCTNSSTFSARNVRENAAV